MDEQFLKSTICYQVSAYCINLTTGHACICRFEAYFLSLLHYLIHLIHLFGRRAKNKGPCCVSNVTGMPKCKVNYYHISLAEFSVCYFSMWQCTVRTSCYDERV